MMKENDILVEIYIADQRSFSGTIITLAECFPGETVYVVSVAGEPDTLFRFISGTSSFSGALLDDLGPRFFSDSTALAPATPICK